MPRPFARLFPRALLLLFAASAAALAVYLLLPAKFSLFTPETEQRATLVPEEEVRALVAKMTQASLGITSFNDFAFAIEQSLSYSSRIASRRKDAALSLPGLQATHAEFAASFAHLKELLPRLDKEPHLLAEEFYWYRIGPDFLITGYYEPTLKASRTQTEAYPYPLYKRPPDLKKTPYFTRNDIDRKGALAGKGLELVYVSDETDAYFLQIQGSGRLSFEDGSESHVLYADKNNRAYVPLGRVMRDKGLLEPGNVTMQSIRAYLAKHPEMRAALFDENPSYVFFSESKKGPYGCIGRVLTPYISIATDNKVLPYGSLLFTVTTLPDEEGKALTPFYGLTLPQDTGGAIKKQRIDLFCGAGEQAAHIAGHQNAAGAVYMLLAKKAHTPAPPEAEAAAENAEETAPEAAGGTAPNASPDAAPQSTIGTVPENAAGTAPENTAKTATSTTAETAGKTAPDKGKKTTPGAKKSGKAAPKKRGKNGVNGR